MNKIACLYSIVQFRPFVETGEFANVGIILMAPEHRYFGHKLMYLRHSRVTHFFEQLDAKVFRATIRNLKEELDDAHSALKHHGFDKRLKHNDVGFARRLFEEIVRPREAVIRFGETRAVLAANPATTLDELYAFYVERNFVNREYQEALLDRGVRKWLFQANLAERFESRAVGDDIYHVTFPFVEADGDNSVAQKAIKPLNLGHAHPSKILDHGGQWLFRIDQLRRRGVLPKQVLFPVSGPEDASTARRKAALEIVEALEELDGISVISFGDRERLLEFAAH